MTNAKLKPAVFHIEKQLDAAILDALEKVVANAGMKADAIDLQFLFTETFPSLKLDEYRQDPTVKAVLAQQGQFIQRFSISFQQGRQVVVARDPSGKDQRWWHDTVTVSPSNDHDAKTFVNLLAQVRANLGVLDPQAVLRRSLDDGNAHLDIAREQSLKHLEALVAKLIEQNANLGVRLSTQFSEQLLLRQNNLQADYDKRRTALDQDFDAGKKQLDERQQQLDAKLAAIDDRTSKHVRRQIRAELIKEFKERSTTFELTEGTQKRRRVVFWFTVFLLVAFGLGAGDTFLQIRELLPTLDKAPPSLLIWLAIKQLAYTAIFGATSVFFIRWNQRWFEQHADEEFRLKRLQLDFDRACWLVEMALEWKEEKDTEIPDALLAQLGKNLFASDDSKERGPLHPADQLASAVFGAAANFKLKTPAGELEFDRKSLKDLKQDTDA